MSKKKYSSNVVNNKMITFPTDGSFVFGIHNRYIPKKIISEGGFGSVWELANPKMVCKFSLTTHSLSSEAAVMDRIHARLQKDVHLKKYIQIPRVFEHGTCMYNSERKEYIVMERLGNDLGILKNIHFSNELNRIYAILRAGVKILKGLYVLHVYFKLVHGDVKPSNFLFRDLDVTKVTTDDIVFIDLGLVREVRKRDIQTSGLNGTRSYASIHVHKNFLPTPRCDLESLGYMLLGFIDLILPWNKEVRKLKKEASEENDNEVKFQREQLCLGKKREFRKRILEEDLESNGENMLAEYFYLVYNLPTIPDVRSYKMLSQSLYKVLNRLQSYVVE